MTQKPKIKPHMIPADAYPQMVSKTAAAAMASKLRSHITAANGSRIIADRAGSLQDAVRAYVEQLENAGLDFDLVSEKAHEIRGFAETAGMFSTGRIADGLCRYFDDVEQAGLMPDTAVVCLHISAIGRAARDPNAASQMSDTVARELAVLAGHKLAESRKAPKNS